MNELRSADLGVQTYGKPDSGRFARAQRNFIKSLAGKLPSVDTSTVGNILANEDRILCHYLPSTNQGSSQR